MSTQSYFLGSEKFFWRFRFLKGNKFSPGVFFLFLGLGLKSPWIHFQKCKKSFLLRKYKKKLIFENIFFEIIFLILAPISSISGNIRNFFGMDFFFIFYYLFIIIIVIIVGGGLGWKEFPKSRAMLACMPTWSTCHRGLRANVPACQKHPNFSFLHANVPINVPTYHTVYQCFKLACQHAKRRANFSNIPPTKC